MALPRQFVSDSSILFKVNWHSLAVSLASCSYFLLCAIFAYADIMLRDVAKPDYCLIAVRGSHWGSSVNVVTILKVISA
jgi:hypothetical protein